MCQKLGPYGYLLGYISYTSRLCPRPKAAIARVLLYIKNSHTLTPSAKILNPKPRMRGRRDKWRVAVRRRRIAFLGFFLGVLRLENSGTLKR
jgi:hypothetical protein